MITFADTSRVAGVYARVAGRPSLAITSPQPQGLYLAEEWSLDANGDLLAVVPGSKGVMVTSSATVKSIRVLKP